MATEPKSVSEITKKASAAPPAMSGEKLIAQGNGTGSDAGNSHTVNLGNALQKLPDNANVTVVLQASNLEALQIETIAKNSENVSVEVDALTGKVVLKGGLASIKQALSQVNIDSGFGISHKPLTIHIDVESGTKNYSQKVHLLFNPENGSVVPMLKIGSSSNFEESAYQYRSQGVAADPFALGYDDGEQSVFNYNGSDGNLDTGTTPLLNQTNTTDQSLLSPPASVPVVPPVIINPPVVIPPVDNSGGNGSGGGGGGTPPANQSPTLDSAQADIVANSGSALNLDISANFSDPDADALTYSAELNGGGALPAWLSFNTTTGVFSGTPADGDAGNITVDVTADDGNGNSITDTFIIDVNRLPELDSAQADIVANSGSALNLDISGNFSDADGDTVTYSAELSGGGALPAWLSFNTTTGVFSGTPADGDAGNVTIDVTADDGNATRTDTFVIDVNRLPALDSAQADIVLNSGSALNLDISGNFSDADGDTVTYSAELSGGGALPAWLSFNTTTGVFSGTPADGDAGNVTIDVTADDGNATRTDTFVIDVNRLPELDSAQADIVANSGSALSLDVSGNFSDADGDTLTYSAILNGGGALPAWLSFNTTTGVFSGTPADGDAGDITIDVTADDGNATRTDTFIIDVNRLPALDSAQADIVLNSGSALNLDVSGNFSDADGDTVTYSAELSGGGALPAWLSFNTTTGVFSGTPADGDAGNVTIDVTADDGNATRTDTFVIDVNRRPTSIAIDTAGANVSAAYSFNIASYFSDADGDTLTYSALLNGGGALPAWLSFNTTTGEFSGTPAGGDAGTISITVTGNDGNATTDRTFSLFVSSFTYYGTSGGDNNSGTGGADNMYGSAGNDTLAGGNSNDTVYGGVGDDKLYGDSADDRLYGGEGNDTIYGGIHQDILYGDEGNDVLYGESGADTLYGGAGNDTLDAGDGQNVLYGDDGNDVLSAINTNQTMYGGAGDDVLNNASGVGGRLYGEAGNDSIYGGSSQQSILGGDGNDYITSQIQHDTIYGGNDNDTIYAGGGNDLLYGDDGDDKIFAEDGNDVVYGGNGNDTLSGGLMDDQLYGGAGSNTLTGDLGNDLFIFNDASSTGNHITDFRTGNDIIRLSDAVFVFKSGEGAKNGVALTNNTDIFSVAGFAGGNFSAGGGATFLYDSTDGEVWYDADGDGGGGAAALILTIDNFASYTYSSAHFYGVT